MKPTYIVGANGAAKEIFLLIKDINKVEKRLDFKGFIDLNPKEKQLRIGANSYQILDESEFIKKNDSTCNIIFAIAFPSKITQVIEKYTSDKNFEFPNIIHPSIDLDDSVSLGKGNIITKSCVFTIDISIGDFNYINRGVHIGHDTTIGNYNVINPCAVISGGINIKDKNLIGTNSTILQYLTIGSLNTIGAGAVVTKSITDNITSIGVPAKPLRYD